jgi:glutamate-1-semialdehyde 2,1-aminomutase
MAETAARAPLPPRRSQQLVERSRRCIAGDTSNWNMVPDEPIYLHRGAGARVWSVDGDEYLDLSNNWAAVIHGHAHPSINAAAEQATADGASFSFPTEYEIALAEILCERVPSAERIKFCMTGTMASELAVKAAYAFTGRSKIVKIEGLYHGHYDPLFVNGPMGLKPEEWGPVERPRTLPCYRNMPAEIARNTAVIPANRAEVAASVFAEIGDQVAAVFVDLVPRQIGHIPLNRHFVQVLQSLAHRHGALFVVDEVMSFRVGRGGAQESFGISPDMTMFAKIIGGGFPLGALGGKREIMRVFSGGALAADVPVYGTFTANPVALAAGGAAMRALDETAFTRLEQLGDRLRQGVNRIFRRQGRAGLATGTGSLFAVQFQADLPMDFRTALHRGKAADLRLGMFRHMVSHGVLLDFPFFGALSLATSNADIDGFLEIFDDGLRSLAQDG